MKNGGNIRRPLAGALSLLAVLVNLFGWALLPMGAEAASSVSAPTASRNASICHTEPLPASQSDKPVCIQCFPLLSAAGALLPQAADLPPPPTITAETVLPSPQAPGRPAGSVVYPARGPPFAA